MYFESDRISINRSSENKTTRHHNSLELDHDDLLQYPNEGKQLRYFDYNNNNHDDNVIDGLFYAEMESPITDGDHQELGNMYTKEEIDVQSDAMSVEDIIISHCQEEKKNYLCTKSISQPIRVVSKSPVLKSSNSTNADTPSGLRSVFEISEQYRHIFAGYPCFNAIQSQVMDDMLYSDKPVVVAAPTGSGKTVLFEMAIVRLLQSIEDRGYQGDFKIVYMAPVKALCSERFNDWQAKLGPLGLTCREVTGDSDTNDYFELRDVRVILTTPEKWDSLTRKWRDNKSLVQVVKLFLIDEVHLLNEERRGPTMEAVVSRMKTVQHSLESEQRSRQHRVHQPQQPGAHDALPHGVRFVAVSATIPNIEDVAEWLSDSSELPAAAYKISEEQRPVKLKKVVLGFPTQESWSPFRFDLSLTYKLKKVLFTHAEGKPSLVFCSTRKGVQQTAAVLVKDITFHISDEQREQLTIAAQYIKDAKLKESVLRGVGCHHAGMDANDRHTVEQLFRGASLPVLVATSTLAMGVNLPAHLVVIKSTEQYVGGVYREYPESQLLQMMGRAGRPQYDTSATAVIMTKSSLKTRYERLVDGRQIVESSLHRHLPEHLNAEVVLHTITDLGVAMDWVRSTFLYVRALRSPKAYGVAGHQPGPENCTRDKIETRLHELCMRELNALASCEIVELDGMDVVPTDMGRLMARYYMKLDSMKIFMQLTGDETMPELLAAVSRCAEFSEVQLRVNERRPLNTLNRCKERETVRFPLPGKVKGHDMKVNVLIQAALGNLLMPDPALHQETVKVIRIGQRVSKCLAEFMAVKRSQQYRATLHATLLAKDFCCRLWHDSPLVSRQLDRIGPALASQLAAAGKNSFDTIRDANPRDLERIVNRAPPLGNMLQSAVSRLPRYTLRLSAEEKSPQVVSVSLELELENAAALEADSTAGERHSVVLLLAERNSNRLLHRERLTDSFLMKTGAYIYESEFQKKEPLKDGAVESKSIEIIAHVISEHWVGLDVESLVRICPRPKAAQQQQQPFPTPRLNAAPRNLKAALQKFVRKQVEKAVLAPGSPAASEPRTPAVGRAPAKTSAASCTPVSEGGGEEQSGRSMSEQIRAKYGQLPVIPVTRIGHHAATVNPPPSLTEAASEADKLAAMLPTASAMEPPQSPQPDEPLSPCSLRLGSQSPFLNMIRSPESSYSQSPSYSPLSSQEPESSPKPPQALSISFIHPLASISSPRLPDFEIPADVPQLRLLDQVFTTISFDLGIEELLADEPPPPIFRDMKRPPLTPSRPAVTNAKQRRLTPPRELSVFQQLVCSVLGTPSPLPSSGPSTLRTDNLRSPEPQQQIFETEVCKIEPSTTSLERLSPCSFLDATLTSHGPAVTWSDDLEFDLLDWQTPATPAAARNWDPPSPPPFLPPAPRRQPRTWETRPPVDHRFMFN